MAILGKEKQQKGTATGALAVGMIQGSTVQVAAQAAVLVGGGFLTASGKMSVSDLRLVSNVTALAFAGSAAGVVSGLAVSAYGITKKEAPVYEGREWGKRHKVGMALSFVIAAATTGPLLGTALSHETPVSVKPAAIVPAVPR